MLLMLRWLVETWHPLHNWSWPPGVASNDHKLVSLSSDPGEKAVVGVVEYSIANLSPVGGPGSRWQMGVRCAGWLATSWNMVVQPREHIPLDTQGVPGVRQLGPMRGHQGRTDVQGMVGQALFQWEPSLLQDWSVWLEGGQMAEPRWMSWPYFSNRLDVLGLEVQRPSPIERCRDY